MTVLFGKVAVNILWYSSCGCVAGVMNLQAHLSKVIVLAQLGTTLKLAKELSKEDPTIGYQGIIWFLGKKRKRKLTTVSWIITNRSTLENMLKWCQWINLTWKKLWNIFCKSWPKTSVQNSCGLSNDIVAWRTHDN